MKIYLGPVFWHSVSVLGVLFDYISEFWLSCHKAETNLEEKKCHTVVAKLQKRGFLYYVTNVSTTVFARGTATIPWPPCLPQIIARVTCANHFLGRQQQKTPHTKDFTKCWWRRTVCPESWRFDLMPHFCLAVIERCQTAPSPVRFKYLQVCVGGGGEGWHRRHRNGKLVQPEENREDVFPPRLKREDTVTDRRRQEVILNLCSHRWFETPRTQRDKQMWLYHWIHKSRHKHQQKKKIQFGF